MRRFGTAGRDGTVRILLQDAATPQRAHAPLLALAQRLPSVFLFREVFDPVDRAYPSAFICNDAGGFYFRGLGHRFDGEADLHAPGPRAPVAQGFDRIWERSRAVTEYRSLGIWAAWPMGGAAGQRVARRARRACGGVAIASCCFCPL